MSDGGEYGFNIVRLLADYPDFVICGDERGYTARTRTDKESAGATLRDLTLDGLASQMDICRHRLDGA